MKDLSLKRFFPSSTYHNTLASFKSELNKMTQDFYNNWFNTFTSPNERFEEFVINPAIDVIDENDHFKVEVEMPVEMPGMGEEDVKVSITNNLLIVKGEKATSKKDKGKNYMLREISYGTCERRIPLPDSLDVDKAKASFKKGMLWVDIPKKPESIKEPPFLEIQKASE